MSKFRKRSVIVEAEQFKGQECLPFAGRGDPCRYDYPSYEWVVDTLEGPLPISRGDWIIKEPTSGFHVCKADVFEQTYEPVMTGYHDVEEFYKHDPNEKQETHGICAVGEELEPIRKRMESKEAIQGEPVHAANNSIDFVAFVRSILDGSDTGHGVLADPRLESLRQDLLALVAKKETNK